MKKLMTLMLGVVLSFPVSAQAANKGEIWELLQRIEGELRYYNQSPETLRQVKERMEDALQILRGGPIADPQACIDFAYAEYRKDGFSNSLSLERARTFCARAAENGTTLNVIGFFYESIRKDGFSVSLSLQHTLDMSRNVTEQRLPCVRSAYSRYSQDGFSNRTSLQKAVEFCAR